MQIDAQNFVDKAEQWLPGIEMAARLTGRPILKSVAAILRRVTEFPDTKKTLVEWLRWTPIFSASDGTDANPEPSLPKEFADLQAEAIEMRVAVQDSSDPTD